MARTLWTAVAAVVFCATVMVTPTGAAGTAARVDAAKDRREGITQAQKSAKIFNEIMGISDEEKKIPRDLLSDAECIAVFPSVVKAAFIFGGSGGKGVVSCRDPKTGKWGPPVFLKVGGASWGAQIGAESADFILVGVNRDSQQVFEKGEWKLGAEAGVAAGPVGRKASAGTDVKLNSEFLSYSRSKGLFAGISLDGSKIQLDNDVNSAIYGADATAASILMGQVQVPSEVSGINVFPQTLSKYGRPKPDATKAHKY